MPCARCGDMYTFGWDLYNHQRGNCEGGSSSSGPVLRGRAGKRALTGASTGDPGKKACVAEDLNDPDDGGCGSDGGGEDAGAFEDEGGRSDGSIAMDSEDEDRGVLRGTALYDSGDEGDDDDDGDSDGSDGSGVGWSSGGDGGDVCDDMPDRDIDDDDAEYLTRHTDWGRPDQDLSPAQLGIFSFLALVTRGEGMSGAAAKSVLGYVRGLGGEGALLPATVRSCWRTVRAYHGARTTGRRRKTHRLAVPDGVRAFLPDGQPDHVEFECEDIVTQLIGILRSPVWEEGEIALGYEPGYEYADYCHGERAKRAQDAVGRNKGVLFFTMFVDGLNIDKVCWDVGVPPCF